MRLREYRPADCEKLAQLFFETVHSVNAKDYSEQQLNAWAAGNIDFEEWNRSFLDHKTVVALEDEQIIGFGDIDETGYLDRLFVSKDHQGTGAASAICDELECSVKGKTIRTNASVTAKPFFEHHGYHVVKKQEVIRHGIALLNYVMEKK